MLGLDKNSGKDCTECEDHCHGGCDEDTPPREPTPPRVVGAMRTSAVAHDDTMTHPRSRGEGLSARHQFPPIGPRGPPRTAATFPPARSLNRSGVWACRPETTSTGRIPASDIPDFEYECGSGGPCRYAAGNDELIVDIEASIIRPGVFVLEAEYVSAEKEHNAADVGHFSCLWAIRVN